MKALGSLVVAVLVGIFALWLLVKLVFVTLKLVGILLALFIAVIVYFVAERLIRGTGDA
jgi:hypothetical protein